MVFRHLSSFGNCRNSFDRQAADSVVVKVIGSHPYTCTFLRSGERMKTLDVPETLTRVRYVVVLAVIHGPLS